jgi:hypothetical protein
MISGALIFSAGKSEVGWSFAESEVVSHSIMISDTTQLISTRLLPEVHL